MTASKEFYDWESRQETRQMEELREEIGRRVKDPIGTKVLLNLLRGRLRRGDRLALVQCVVFCRDRHANIPNWAVKALAGQFEDYLDGSVARLDHAVLGRRVGRHADPRKEAEDHWIKERVYFAVARARVEREEPRRRGVDAIDRAQAILRDELHLFLARDTIAKYSKTFPRDEKRYLKMLQLTGLRLPWKKSGGSLDLPPTRAQTTKPPRV